jgi:hypothetical protein
MTGDNPDKDSVDDLEVEDSGNDETVVLDTAGDEDSFGDTIVAASVDALVAKVDSTDADELARKRAARKRLDELQELKNQDLDDTFNFNLDDDL